ncbi:hypothetical protein M408DRAFT_233163 [Serendipita vermifera MAFF 305830]|uniref:Uncharacterized protein n=1 Tax=Serendipita vermifera MAFF 305830 TaxID=933852 RepID=A0A0C3AIA2_SERVB|nr:hypothetical protein M408DRAFT_233163 [Serendipita vermifera MAFF 305830]
MPLVDVYEKFDELGLHLAGVPWYALWRRNQYLVSFWPMRRLDQLARSYTILRPVRWVQWVASWTFTIIEAIAMVPTTIIGILFFGWRISPY